MSNLGPVLLGVAAIITACGGILLGLRARTTSSQDALPTTSAFDDVSVRINVLHGTIADLEKQLQDCRRGRDKVERMLEHCRAERHELLDRLARQGDPP